MNELKEIADRLNGCEALDEPYVILFATHDDKTGTWSLKVRRADEAKGAAHDGD